VHIADITRDGLYIDLDTTAYKRQPLAQEEALYRIVQEALNNIVKHAHARRIEITLRAVGGLTPLTVRDDGRGFAIEPAGVANGVRSRTSGGLGLRNMRERAEALGAGSTWFPHSAKGPLLTCDCRRKMNDRDHLIHPCTAGR
jgi:signal transduction histidine kinase